MPILPTTSEKPVAEEPDQVEPEMPSGEDWPTCDGRIAFVVVVVGNQNLAAVGRAVRVVGARVDVVAVHAAVMGPGNDIAAVCRDGHNGLVLLESSRVLPPSCCCFDSCTS